MCAVDGLLRVLAKVKRSEAFLVRHKQRTVWHFTGCPVVVEHF